MVDKAASLDVCNPMETEGDYQSCAVQLKALADADRLRIVNHLLRKGPKSVSGLADELGVGMVKMSHHLGVLRAARLVQTRKDGKFVVYSLMPEIAVAADSATGAKTINLGCCQLGIAQPKSAKESPARSAKHGRS